MTDSINYGLRYLIQFLTFVKYYIQAYVIKEQVGLGIDIYRNMDNRPKILRKELESNMVATGYLKNIHRYLPCRSTC